VGYGSSIAISLVTVSLTLRHLGVAEAGRLFAGLSALALASALSDMGLAGLGLRDYATRPRPGRREYLRQLVTARSLLFAAAAGPAIALAAGAIGHQPSVVIGLIGGATAYLGSVLVTTASIPFAEELDTTTQSLVQVVQSGAALVTTITLVAVNAGLPWFFGFQLPGAALALVLLRQRGRRLPIPWPRLSSTRAAWALIDRQVLVFGAAVIIGVAFYRVGSLAVAYLAGARQAGLYGSAFRVADVLEAAAPLLMMIVLPVLASNEVSPERFRGRVRTTIAVMAPLGAVAGAGTFGLAPVAISLVGGPQYAAAVVPLQVLSAMLVLAYPCQVYGYALLARRQHAAMLVSVSLALATSTVTLLLLVPPLGARGAAISLAVGQAALLAGYLWFYRSAHGAAGHLPPLVVAGAGYLLAVAAGTQVEGLWPRAVVSILAAVVLVWWPAFSAVRSLMRSR
jgi:O-antigen/teichoic acid export membrane protein